MKKHELELVSKLLKMTAEHYSNHGCNDVDREFWDWWTPNQKRELLKDIHDWNGDPEEYNPDCLAFQDWHLMEYFADKLTKGE